MSTRKKLDREYVAKIIGVHPANNEALVVEFTHPRKKRVTVWVAEAADFLGNVIGWAAHTAKTLKMVRDLVEVCPQTLWDGLYIDEFLGPCVTIIPDELEHMPLEDYLILLDQREKDATSTEEADNHTRLSEVQATEYIAPSD